jgi:hypothetical protein
MYKGGNMKMFKCFCTVLLILGFAVSVPAYLFAQDAPDLPEDVKLLREAASALKPYNPELSAKVNNYADMEAEELLGREGTEAEAAILKEAAAALKGPDPDLANRLDAFADKEIKMEEEEY